MLSKKHNCSKAFGAILLTLVWPFAGLILALAKWRKPWAKNVFWLVCIYMGAVQIFWPEGTVLGVGADAGRYVEALQEMCNQYTTMGDIFDRYLIDANTMDLYQPLLTCFVSHYTDNGHVLFFVFALVFGFFYSRNIWYILEKLRDSKLGKFFILVTLYFLVCPITQINGVRMWTALQVFVYALMPYLVDHDRSKLWWVLLTPLIHFSYLYVALFALAFAILPYRLKTKSSIFLLLALIFFIVTLFINTLQLDAVNSALEEYSPESYEQRIDDYVNQDLLDWNREAADLNNWYVAGSTNVLFWCYNILLLLMLPCLKIYFKENDRIIHLYVFTLLLSGFANLMALIPSGGRFQLLTQMFKVPLILLVVTQIPKRTYFYLLVKVSMLVLLVPFVVEFRKLFDFYGINLFVGNFATVFFWETNVPLIDYIKQLV